MPLDETAQVEPLIAEPKAARVIGRPFLPGQSGNVAGRPRKGQTIAERVAAADAKVARKAIKARDERLQMRNATGERAWSTYLAYNLGLPAQKYILENASADAAVSVLLQRMQVVDAEYKLLPDTDNP